EAGRPGSGTRPGAGSRAHPGPAAGNGGPGQQLRPTTTSFRGRPTTGRPCASCRLSGWPVALPTRSPLPGRPPRTPDMRARRRTFRGTDTDPAAGGNFSPHSPSPAGPPRPINPVQFAQSCKTPGGWIMDRHGAVGRAAWAVAFGLVAAGAAIGAYPPQTGDAGQPPPIPGQPVTGQPPPVVGQPVQSVMTTPPAVASSIPETYVYVVRGVDPMGWSGVSGLANQIRAGGSPNTRYGFWYQMPQFEREIRQLYRQNPGIQVVLIGHSAGVYQVRAAANRLTRDGVPVSMVGYVGGDYLRDSSYTRVNGATQVVNVTGDGYL